MLLDAYALQLGQETNTYISFYRWAIPVCLFLSWVYMRTKYHWTQLLVSRAFPTNLK